VAYQEAAVKVETGEDGIRSGDGGNVEAGVALLKLVEIAVKAGAQWTFSGAGWCPSC